MALIEREIFTKVDTVVNILANLQNGMRAFSSDTHQWIQRDLTGNFYFLPSNKKYEGSTYTFLDVEFKDITGEKLYIDSVKDSYLTEYVPISESGVTNLSGDFNAISIIGSLNELMDYIQGGTLTNFWTHDSVTHNIRPIDDLNVESLYIEKGLKNEAMEDDDPTYVLEIGQTGNTWLIGFDPSVVSIIGALNELRSEINNIDYPSILYAGIEDVPYPVVEVEQKEDGEGYVKLRRPLYMWTGDGCDFDDNYYMFFNIFNQWAILGNKDPNTAIFIGRNLLEEKIPGIDYTLYMVADIFYIGDGTINTVCVDSDYVTFGIPLSFGSEAGIDTYIITDSGFKFGRTSVNHYTFEMENDGDGITLNFGSYWSATAEIQFLDELILSASTITIKKHNQTFDLFDIVNFTNYPTTLYYDNDPLYYKVSAIITGLEITGKISFDSVYEQPTYHTAMEIFYWAFDLSTDHKYLKMCCTAPDCTTYKMYIGTYPDVVSGTQVVDEINLFATHVYVQKDAGGSKWDLISYVQGGLYPTSLYAKITDAIKVECYDTSIQIHDCQFDLTDCLVDTTPTPDEQKYFYTDSWYMKALLVSSYYSTLELYSTSSASKLYLGTVDTESTGANFISDIYLRAQHIWIQDGTKNIDLLTLTTAGGLTKATRAYMSSTQSLSTGSETLIHYNSETYDDDNRYSTSTYKFTADTAAIHSVNASVTVTLGASGIVQIRIYKNSTLVKTSSVTRQVAASLFVSTSIDIKLAVNDTVEARVFQDSGYTATIETGGSFEIAR